MRRMMTQYKAEHIVGLRQLRKMEQRMQVFKCKKSVFRSATRERVSVTSCPQAEIQ